MKKKISIKIVPEFVTPFQY